jgi:hypothetical protein
VIGNQWKQKQTTRKENGMSLVLESKAGGDFKPHVEGIHPAVCVDVIDLGMVETEFQGQRRLVNKVRLVFETEQRNEEGRNCSITKTFTASLHPKAKLADFLGKWRGRPVVPGESIDLAKLIGANCTLVISHQQNMVGRTYASIDAVSKPTKRLAASGQYDPEKARQRIAEWKAREAGNQSSVISGQSCQSSVIGGQRQGQAAPQNRTERTNATNTTSPQPSPRSGEGAQPKRAAPGGAPAATGPSRTGQDFDPEVGF